jgi:hypothetical protein
MFIVFVYLWLDPHPIVFVTQLWIHGVCVCVCVCKWKGILKNNMQGCELHSSASQ